MKVNLTSSKGLESKLSVTITKKEIQKQIDTKLDEVKGTINLKDLDQEKLQRIVKKTIWESTLW